MYPRLFNNYRSISLLSVFSKVLEKIMYDRLSRTHTKRYNLYILHHDTRYINNDTNSWAYIDSGDQPKGSDHLVQETFDRISTIRIRFYSLLKDYTLYSDIWTFIHIYVFAPIA